uniref:Uncharacterized protein n=1 Tax=Bactrocera dorsalis TaxID=27457 RepID=A0A034V6W5_BACDO
MDPNSSPWSYAYNRIVPSASSTGSAEDFQHPHLAPAQSLFLQAAHSGIAASFNAAAAGSGSFVSPSPIGGYNPVFQQIYHHAAAASAQPKPAHYASSAVNTPVRQIQIPSTLDKQLTNFQNQAAVAVVSSAAAAAANNAASNYYGENSSSSGASPSPTTSAITSTTLSWNTPMISNTFLAMQQQQQQQTQQQQQHQQQQAQQPQLNLVAEKVVSSMLGSLVLSLYTKPLYLFNFRLKPKFFIC